MTPSPTNTVRAVRALSTTAARSAARSSDRRRARAVDGARLASKMSAAARTTRAAARRDRMGGDVDEAISCSADAGSVPWSHRGLEPQVAPEGNSAAIARAVRCAVQPARRRGLAPRPRADTRHRPSLRAAWGRRCCRQVGDHQQPVALCRCPQSVPAADAATEWSYVVILITKRRGVFFGNQRGERDVMQHVSGTKHSVCRWHV